jgi:hypothetical protein
MRTLYKQLVILLAISVTMMFSYTASSEPVRCEQCTEEYPCATLFEFKNVRFTHTVFCKVDEEGREIWDSNDNDKFDMFYFEVPNSKRTESEIKL